MDQTFLMLLTVGGLLLISVLASLVSTRLGAPLLLVFLIIGMLAGEDGPLGLHFDNARLAFLVGNLALVVILFDGGLRTHPQRFRVALAPAATLASVGVLVTCGLIGAIASWILEIPLVHGLLLGALLSSTDAAAVFSIFQSQSMRLKERVAATLEIESGSNDPVAVILTMLLVQMVAEGVSGFHWGILLQFLQQLLVGAGGGWLGGRLLIIACRKLPLATAFFPILAVAGSLVIFAGTSTLGGSGFLAVYIAGFLLGNQPLTPVHHILRVHDGLTWLAQIVMFLLLGLLVTPSQMLPLAPKAMLIALALIFLARPVAVFLGLSPFRFPWRDQVFIAWVGLRGAVPIILALFPLMAGVPDARLYFNVAFFVVLVSLMIQGWTLAPAARRLGLEIPPEPEPVTRQPLEGPGVQLHEIVGFAVQPASVLRDHEPEEIRWPAHTHAVAVQRGEELFKPHVIGELRTEDVVYFIAEPPAVHELSRLFVGEENTERLTPQRFFGEFILRGNAMLGELGRVYGFSPPGDGEQTVGEYLESLFHGRPVIGDSCRLGQMVFTVQRLMNGKVTRVGIRLPPPESSAG